MAGFVTALVLLPTPGSKLEMKWQKPFTVTRALEDGLNYELDTGKTCKQHRTYHINLLSKWQSREEMATLVMEESPEFAITPRKQCSPLWSRGNLGRCYDLG